MGAANFARGWSVADLSLDRSGSEEEFHSRRRNSLSCDGSGTLRKLHAENAESDLRVALRSLYLLASTSDSITTREAFCSACKLKPDRDQCRSPGAK